MFRQPRPPATDILTTVRRWDRGEPPAGFSPLLAPTVRQALAHPGPIRTTKTAIAIFLHLFDAIERFTSPLHGSPEIWNRNMFKPERIALVVGGGPAPGINGVISAVTIEAVNKGIE